MQQGDGCLHVPGNVRTWIADVKVGRSNVRFGEKWTFVQVRRNVFLRHIAVIRRRVVYTQRTGDKNANGTDSRVYCYLPVLWLRLLDH